MRIDLDGLPKEGRTLHLGLGDAIVASVGPEALEATLIEVELTLSVRRTGRERLVVESEGWARGDRPCDRCGREVSFEVPLTQRLPFVSRRQMPNAKEVALSEEDLEIGYFDGSGLELADVVSEVFALSAPDRVTCGRSDCEGVDLAAAEGDVDVESPSPFAALKDLL